MDAKKWNCFLSRQGLYDQNQPPPPAHIHASIEHLATRFTEVKAAEFFAGCNHILVVGAGSGGEVVVLNNLGFKATGTTIIYRDIKFAKLHYNIDLVDDDMHDMKSFTEGTFDGVYSHHSLEHAISPIIALCEIRRVLKVGGKGILVIPHDVPDHINGDQHYSVLSKTMWLSLFNKCGFDVSDVSNQGSAFVFKVVRNNSQCHAQHFETMMKREGVWK